MNATKMKTILAHLFQRHQAVTLTIVLILVVISVTAVVNRQSPNLMQPNTFQQCVEHPDSLIRETFPLQCVTPDGQVFVDEVTPTPSMTPEVSPLPTT